MFRITANVQYRSLKDIDPYVKDLFERKIQDAMVNLEKDLKYVQFRYAGNFTVDIRLNGEITVDPL